MKRILFALTIALGLNASAGISADKAMAKFVYPGNKTVSVAAPEYLADSDVMVRMSDDGKRIVSVSPSDGKELETLLDLGATRENKLDEIDGFTISMTGKQIMVWTNQEPI